MIIRLISAQLGLAGAWAELGKITTQLRKVGLCLHFIHGQGARQIEGRTNRHMDRQIKGQMCRQTALSDIQQIGTHNIFCLNAIKKFCNFFLILSFEFANTHLTGWYLGR